MDFVSASVTPNAGPVSFTPETVSSPNDKQGEDKASSFFTDLDLQLLNNDFF